MGQLPVDHVTLEGVSATGGSTLDFFRVGQDGIREAAEFSPPTTKCLVITELDWLVTASAATTPGELKTLRISIVNVASGQDNIVFETTITVNNSGQGGINEKMKSGFVVSSKGKIRAAPSTVGGVVSIDHVILRGYLTKV